MNPLHDVASLTTSGASVGVPREEAILTSAMLSAARTVYRPGVGRSTYVLSEPQMERGRPDLLVVTASSQGVRGFASQMPPIPSKIAIEALLSDGMDVGTRLSPDYQRRLARQMRLDGWSPELVERAAGLVHSSVAIEAKVRDWRRAVRQISHWGRIAHSTAILMPQSEANKIDLSVADRYQVGILAHMNDGRVIQVRPGIARPVGAASLLWLLELVRRRELQGNILPGGHFAESVPH